MRPHSDQWHAELDRQIKKYNLDEALWLFHFGFFGILPDDECARCENCADHHIGCPSIPGNPLECMKHGGPKVLLDMMED
jgi:hypothetical protein